MKAHMVKQESMLKIFSGLLLGMTLGFGTISSAVADPITAETQAKVERYKKKLQEWAADPVLISAVKEANAKGGAVPGMTNAKWDGLADTDPVVKAMQTSAAGKFVTKLDEETGIKKMFVRDAKGSLVAGSIKPLLFNIADRPVFTAITGKVYSGAEVKTDPTTQKKSVQVSVPILDGGKPHWCAAHSGDSELIKAC